MRPDLLHSGTLLLLFSLLTPSLGQAADEDNPDDDLHELQTPMVRNEWMLAKNDRRHDIRTWIRQEEDKRYRSFKVEATLRCSMAELVRTVLDIRHYDSWYWEVIESRLLRQVSPTEYQIYLRHRAPHGLADRDVAGILRFEPQSAANPTLTVQVKAVPDLMGARKPYVRMEAEDMVIRVTPLARNRLQIVAEGYVDPGGRRIPVWASNFIQRSAPYSIVLGLKRTLETGEERKTGALPFTVREYGE